MKDSLLIFSIPEYSGFAAQLRELVRGEAGEIDRRCFPDGECYQRVVSDVLDRDVVLVGGTVSDSATLTVYDLACALVKDGARRLSIVVPYFGYSTMERAALPGEVVVAKTRARLLSAIPPAAYGNRIFLLDLHSEGITHYFEGAMTAFHISGRPVIESAIRRAGGDSFVLASTDAGRSKWVQGLADDLGVESAFIIKRRISGEKTLVSAVSAQVAGRRVFIYDDMIRTGGSLLGAARAYMSAGATELSAIATHGVFPENALERLIAANVFRNIICTDSHPRALALASKGLEVLPCASVFASHLLPGTPMTGRPTRG